MQFVAIVVRTSHTVYIDCAFSLIYQKMQIACAISQFVLFMNFYIHSYHPKMTEGAMVNNGGNEEKMGLQNGVVNGVTKHPHAD